MRGDLVKDLPKISNEKLRLDQNWDLGLNATRMPVLIIGRIELPLFNGALNGAVDFKMLAVDARDADGTVLIDCGFDANRK